MKTTEHPIEAVRPPTPDELAEIESALAALEEAAPQIEALAERCWKALRVYLAARYSDEGPDRRDIAEEEAFEAAWCSAHKLMDLAYELEGQFPPISASGSSLPTPTGTKRASTPRSSGVTRSPKPEPEPAEKVLSDVTMVRAYLSHAKERATAVMPLAAEITEDGDEISNALWELTSVATDLSESWPRVIGHGL